MKLNEFKIETTPKKWNQQNKSRKTRLIVYSINKM